MVQVAVADRGPTRADAGIATCRVGDVEDCFACLESDPPHALSTECEKRAKRAVGGLDPGFCGSVVDSVAACDCAELSTVGWPRMPEPPSNPPDPNSALPDGKDGVPRKVVRLLGIRDCPSMCHWRATRWGAWSRCSSRAWKCSAERGKRRSCRPRKPGHDVLRYRLQSADGARKRLLTNNFPTATCSFDEALSNCHVSATCESSEEFRTPHQRQAHRGRPTAVRGRCHRGGPKCADADATGGNDPRGNCHCHERAAEAVTLTSEVSPASTDLLPQPGVLRTVSMRSLRPTGSRIGLGILRRLCCTRTGSR